jgi:hypothetical protein
MRRACRLRPGKSSRAATARHYTNLYFRFNRAGPGAAPGGARIVPGARSDGARRGAEQPGRSLSAGMQAPNYAVIRAGRKPGSRTRTQTGRTSADDRGEAGMIGVGPRRRSTDRRRGSTDQREEGMAGNLVIVCRDQDADAFYELMQEYGSFQTRLSSTAWYLNMNVVPESLQEEILERLGRYTTVYIFEAMSVTYNTIDSNAAETLGTLFGE